jgi:hypothetical protein
LGLNPVAAAVLAADNPVDALYLTIIGQSQTSPAIDNNPLARGLIALKKDQF